MLCESNLAFYIEYLKDYTRWLSKWLSLNWVSFNYIFWSEQTGILTDNFRYRASPSRMKQVQKICLQAFIETGKIVDVLNLFDLFPGFTNKFRITTHGYTTIQFLFVNMPCPINIVLKQIKDEKIPLLLIWMWTNFFKEYQVNHFISWCSSLNKDSKVEWIIIAQNLTKTRN